jgi:hypothetical protein
MPAKCETCNHWKADAKECHRYPAQVIPAVVMNVSKGSMAKTIRTEAEWPKTAASDFCGEHSSAAEGNQAGDHINAAAAAVRQHTGG